MRYWYFSSYRLKITWTFMNIIQGASLNTYLSGACFCLKEEASAWDIGTSLVTGSR